MSMMAVEEEKKAEGRRQEAAAAAAAKGGRAAEGGAGEVRTEVGAAQTHVALKTNKQTTHLRVNGGRADVPDFAAYIDEIDVRPKSSLAEYSSTNDMSSSVIEPTKNWV